MTSFGRSTYVTWVGGTALNLLEFSGIAASTDSIEITPYGSSFREFAPGLIDYGSISLTVATDQVNEIARLRRSYIDRTTAGLSIVTPLGFQYSFKGFMTSFTHLHDKNGVYTIQITVKLSGKPTVVLYSTFTVIPHSGEALTRGGAFGLFLAPAQGSDSGGENAHWTVTSSSLQPNTKIIGNTLTIDATQVAPITVTAQLYNEAGQLGPSFTAIYSTIEPSPTSVAITVWPGEIKRKKGSSVTDETLTVVVYPSGASPAITYAVSDDKGTAVAGTIIEATTGKLTVKSGYDASPYGGESKSTRTFSVTVTVTGDTTITDTQYFRVEYTP